MKDAFNRNDFIVKGLNQEFHRGYQKWHRLYDQEIVDWIVEKGDDLTPQQFLNYLNEYFARPEIIKLFGKVEFIF